MFISVSRCVGLRSIVVNDLVIQDQVCFNVYFAVRIITVVLSFGYEGGNI